MRVGEGEREGFHLLPAERQGVIFSWNYASVPGDVYTDLQRAGELEDPYFGRNMHKAKWVQEYEWWYIRRFNVSEKMKGKKVHLDFEGVDYSCTIWLNGNLLGSHEGVLDHRIETDLKDSGATVHVQIELHNMTPENQTFQLQIAMNGHNFTSETISRTLEAIIESGTSRAKVSVEIADAKLCWPWDMGTPYLYNIKLHS